MTSAAVDCLARSERVPDKCTLPTAEHPLRDQREHGRPYRKETRWPDDPTRQSSSAGLIKFLANVGADRCLRYVGQERFAGLLCNSHYGDLQFFHSMASTATGASDPSTEPFEETRAKMLGWTALAYGVATGQLSGNAPFCPTVRAFGAAGAALAPERFAFCGTWTIASLFGQTCRNPLNSRTCRQNNDAEAIRRTAIGAMLHMIQDSYSRSHAGRGEDAPNGPYERAEVRCAPITAFYRYSVEQKQNHPAADLEPVFATSCSTGGSLDPITPSARMIWLVDHRCHVSWAVDLIDRGVIANRATRLPAPEECRAAV